MPQCCATTDENVGGALRAAISPGDKAFRSRRWDNASHIHQATFVGA
jgi:hypothetical protein